MPVILRYKGYCFFLFANEGDPLDPAHIHVRSRERTAKFWVVPEVALADSYRMNSSKLRELAQVVRENRELIEREWNAFFGGQG